MHDPDATISAAIFDLDGTLIDSEPLYEEADRVFLARYGLSWEDIRWEDMVGIGGLEFIGLLKDRFGLTGATADLRREKDRIYLDIARTSLRVFPRMLDLVRGLHDEGLPMAIATGSSMPVLQETTGILDLARYFTVMVSADEVAHGKPAPDVFLEAASRLEVDPGACVVIEDSQYGVEAARRAGMSCIAVPTVISDPLPKRFRNADLVFSGGMDEFSADRAHRWLMQRITTGSRDSRS